MRLQNIALASSTILAGFYGGIGFFTAIGNNPAISKLSDRSFVEYWQNLDGYMGSRMPVFGPLLLLSVVISVLLLIRQWRSIPFVFMLLALVLVIVDVAFTFSVNDDLNGLIQSWDITHLPPNVGEVKLSVVKAFNKRVILMMCSFIFVALATCSSVGRAHSPRQRT